MAADSARLKNSEAMLREIRRWIIQQSLASNVGHIGSALSIADIISALWGSVMRDPGTQSPGRDRFILAKGHAALALYAALRFKGLVSEEQFKTYCGEGSLLGVHPEHALPGVDLSTGSLGQGLSVGCGLAYGLRLRKSPARVYVLMSDAECNEGQVWEAAMFAGHHHLNNLCAVVDLNGLQALGHTRNIIQIKSMAGIFREMGWETFEADGHNIGEMLQIFNAEPSPRPRVIIARTVLGHGVSFMQDKLEWHYRNLTPELAEKALRELESLR